MVPDIYKSIIEKLHNKTMVGKVNWKATADEYAFIVYFKEFSLVIRWYVDDGTETYRISIFNKDGNEIDVFYVDERQNDWVKINDLFTAARRRALRIDDAIVSIESELDDESVVGRNVKQAKPSSQNSTDEDVPF